MGMSDDLAVAVQEGSTEVRIGTALFGPRPRAADRVQSATPSTVWGCARLACATQEECMSLWKKTMDYLGLGPDDAYDDYDDLRRTRACTQAGTRAA